MAHRIADLRIAHKLYAGFAIICLLLITVGGIGISRLSNAQHATDFIANSAMLSVTTAEGTALALKTVRLDGLSLALSPDQASTQAALGQLDSGQRSLDQAWSAYLDSDPTSTTSEQAAYTTALAQYRAAWEKLLPLAEDTDPTAFMSARSEELVPAAAAADQALATIVEAESKTAADLAAQSAVAYRGAVALLLGCCALAIAMAVGIAVVVARSVTRPLSKVVDVMSQVARGRLDQRVRLDRRDEVGQLAVAVDASLEALSAALSEITTEARTLNSSSASLSSVSAQMASGASQAAAQTQVVAAASEEVTVSISTVAAAGEEMTAAIAQIATATAEASSMATHAVSAAGSAGGAIQRLGISSQEIGDVVKLITSIAEQTNLLALNATIEAARAGELGKGFAVVAGEVKELARQTARATEEIIAKVSATQGDAAAAAAAVTQIGEVIARIDEVQATIAAAVEEQSATTSEMVRNVTEISTGSAQISANVTDIAAGTDHNRQSARNLSSHVRRSGAQVLCAATS